MKKISIISLMLLTFVFSSCKKNSDRASSPAPDCNGVDSRFAARVLPIFQGSCATNISCHGNGSSNGPGALSNYSQISGNAIIIKSAVVSGEMPLGTSLNAQDKNAIICWINSGAPNN